MDEEQCAKMRIDMTPIGIVRSPFQERFAAPRQPSLGGQTAARILLRKDLNLHQALTDLDGFSHIWILYWMHLNQGWNPTVMPPRGPKIRRGVLATRAPHRPNSIGLSAVRLTKISGLTLHIEGCDMLDGTPVLDIKPYLPYADAIPDADPGWTCILEENASGLTRP
ncbi:MAG: tRNA (N6-threonylcarbamoyladenosine(37)-N6)-methyltransferase TrmO [Zetaproteobacteria bacterium]|nr:MAG: tRNA (N6-threonylcarbamoyladenosine(37)-N6)-methyltransferase TrmO [Zetaproteobacteria bacterium]